MGKILSHVSRSKQPFSEWPLISLLTWKSNVKTKIRIQTQKLLWQERPWWKVLQEVIGAVFNKTDINDVSSPHWQATPVYPGRQRHVYAAGPSTHDAPFRQGELLHWSYSERWDMSHKCDRKKFNLLIYTHILMYEREKNTGTVRRWRVVFSTSVSRMVDKIVSTHSVAINWALDTVCQKVLVNYTQKQHRENHPPASNCTDY